MQRVLFAVLICLSLLLISGVAVSGEKSLEDFVKHDEFRSISLSPNGQYIAVAAPSGDQTGLVVIDVSNPEAISATTAFELRSEEHVADMYWGSNERILFTTHTQEGTLHQPQPTGRIYGVDLDGGGLEMLYGSGEGDRVARFGTILSTLPDEPDRALIQSVAHDRSYPRALLMDIHDGRTRTVATSPLENGSLLADHDGVVRFAQGSDEDGSARFSYRESEDDDWQDFDSEFDADSLSLYGFSADNEDVFFTTSETGRMGLYRLSLSSGEAEALLESDRVALGGTAGLMRGQSVLWDQQNETVIGAVFEDGKPEMRFIDPEEESSRFQRSIAAAFPDQFSRIVSFARDSDRAIVQVEADVAPPAWFLFDLEEMSASYLLGSRDWVEPENMHRMEPVQLEARDGKELHGYLTRPNDREGAGPMVVLVHGGPHGPRDIWAYDPEVQLLADSGYSVLQVNFRGSGGYGDEFEQAGYREWGRAMQDDVTDATHWAIEEGHADEERICIYGGSYGGYSAMMGLVREPELYACGAAVVGVFDLPLFTEEGNIPERVRGGEAYLRRVLGEDEDELKARSPARKVEKIQAPVYLSHGEEDRQAHIGQFHFFSERLDEAGIDHESRLFEGEGHGYYDEGNRRTYYGELLDFLDRHIGD